jgi:hypothetical protein
LSVVAFRPYVQCINAEVESSSAQSNCCRQTVCPVYDEISSSKNGVDIFKLVIAAAERLDPCERIDSQDAPGSDVALWFSDIIGHEGGLANILTLYASAID